MPLLATFLVSIFSAFFSFFARFFVLEKAARLAAWSVAAVLMAALMTSMMSCVNGVCAASIAGIGSAHEYIGMGLGIVFNSTTLAAVGCYMTVWIVCQLYVIKKKAINMIVGAN